MFCHKHESHEEASIELSTATKDQIVEAAKEGRVSVRSAGISAKILDEVFSKFEPSDIADMLVDLSKATKLIPSKNKGEGPISSPDNQTRLAVAQLLIAYGVGTPVKREERVTRTIDSLTTLRGKLRQSPALRRAVKKMLSDMDPNIDAIPVRSEPLDPLDSLSEDTPVRIRGGRSVEDKYG